MRCRVRSFSIAAKQHGGRISCNTEGVFVSDVPLLQKQSLYGRYAHWTVRPIVELNDELSSRYRFPIDISCKTNALALIANAFSRGDIAIAAIATVQMRGGYVEFLVGDTPTPIAARYILSFEELKTVALYFLETGGRSDRVSWRELDPKAVREDAARGSHLH